MKIALSLFFACTAMIIFLWITSKFNPAKESSEEVFGNKFRDFEHATFDFYAPGSSFNSSYTTVLVYGLMYSDSSSRPSDLWIHWSEREHSNLLAAKFYLQAEQQPYILADRETGPLLLSSLVDLQEKCGLSRIPTPLVLIGHSAAGTFCYNFARSFPEHTCAFVCIKGGVYSDYPTPTMCHIPCLLIIGDKDTEFRQKRIRDIFLHARRSGAPWSLFIDKNAGHEEGASLQFALPWIKAVMKKRVSPNGKLRSLDDSNSWLGSLNDGTIAPRARFIGSVSDAVWLPDAQVAALWHKMNTGEFTADGSLPSMRSLTSAPELKIDPQILDFGSVKELSGSTEFHSDVRLGKSSWFSDLSLRCPYVPPGFQVKAKKTSSNTWRISVICSPLIEPLGSVNRLLPIRIYSTNNKEALAGESLILKARITGDVLPFPTSLYFGYVPPGESRKQLLVVKGLSSQAITFDSFSYDGTDTVNVTPVENASTSLRLKVDLRTSKSSQLEQGGNLILNLHCPNPIVVRIAIIVNTKDNAE